MVTSVHFQRFAAADAPQLASDIERAQKALLAAQAGTDPLAHLERAGELASMLTTARREAEASELLLPLLSIAEQNSAHEPAGWYFLALATASQYLELRTQANSLFGKALELARAHSWQALEHFTLHHWGRSLVEEHNFTHARECFNQALAIRERLNEPRQSSTRRALLALEEFAPSAGNGNA